jgi:hypothetical protein
MTRNVSLEHDFDRNIMIKQDTLPTSPSDQPSSSITVSKTRQINIAQYDGRYLCVKFNSYQLIQSVLNALGFTLPKQWDDRFKRYVFGLTYSSTTHRLYLDAIPTIVQNVKRSFRFQFPVFTFQLQTASFTRSLTYNPIEPCQSEIFRLCSDGNIEMVKIWFKRGRASPFVVNQHGENLLHVRTGPFSLMI